MITRRETFNCTLKVIGLQDSYLNTLLQTIISSLGLMFNFNTNDLPDTISQGKLKSIQLFQRWLTNARTFRVDSDPIDWSTFTKDTWEDFMIDQAAKHESIYSINTSNQVSTGANQQVIDVTAYSSPAFNGIPNLKIDIKYYPEFDGKLQSWKSFKQKFLSVATIHGIQVIMVPSFIVPTNPSNTPEVIESFKSKNYFLQSILELSLAKST